MTNQEKVKKYFGEIHHFLECGGWPVKIDNKIKNICKDIPALAINEKGLLCRDESHDWDSDLLAEYWKSRYNEVNKEYERMYSKLRSIVNEF